MWQGCRAETVFSSTITPPLIKWSAQVVLREVPEAYGNSHLRFDLKPDFPAAPRQFTLVQALIEVAAEVVVNVERETGHALIDLMETLLVEHPHRDCHVDRHWREYLRKNHAAQSHQTPGTVLSFFMILFFMIL